jgi:hypothetical protein
LSLCLTKHEAMKAYEGVEVQLHVFLNSALDGCEWSAARPDSFTPGERTAGAHFLGGWVDPRACLNAVAKRKIRRFRRETQPDHSAHSLVAIPTELSRFFYLSMYLYV